MGGRKIGLAVWRALSSRGAHIPFIAERDRPEGELIWLHSDTPERLAALRELGARLKQQRGQVSVLATLSSSGMQDRTGPDHPFDWLIPLPGDHPDHVRQFLAHWRPDLCIWAGSNLRPNMIGMTRQAGVSMALVDLENDAITLEGGSWVPQLQRACLECFDTVLAPDQDTADWLMRRGIGVDRVRVSGRLRKGASALPVDETEIDALQQMIGRRPVWLAAYITREELPMVLWAHRSAQRLAHRLMLVVVPDALQDADTMRDHIANDSLSLACWVEGQDPDENTQVVLAERGREMGMWYRVAPVTFIGGSLTTGSHGNDPFEAAALGSAIVYGPNVRDHLSTYSRLAAAGAARIVKDAEGLAVAVNHLIAPDQSAAMALAGWEVASESAFLIDELLEIAHTHLDQGKGGA